MYELFTATRVTDPWHIQSTLSMLQRSEMGAHRSQKEETTLRHQKLRYLQYLGFLRRLSASPDWNLNSKH